MVDQATPFTDDVTPAPAAEGVAPVADPQPAASPTPTINIPDSVKDMVGEGKKYTTVEAALNALPHAQSHIEKIEAENALYREKVEGARNTEDVLAEIKAAAQSKEQPAVTPTPQVSAEDIASMVDQRLQATEAQKIAASNTATVVNTMEKHYGDAAKAEEVYKTKAEELGMSVADLNQLTVSSPKAVLNLFGLVKSEASVPEKMHSSINTEALLNKPPAEQPVGSVMGGSTTKQAASAWLAAAPKENN